MTSKMFVDLAEKYYGKYSAVVRQDIEMKLLDWDPASVEELWDEARENIQISFKTPPDIYFIAHSNAQLSREKRAHDLKVENTTRRLTGQTQRKIGYATEYDDKVLEIVSNAFKGKLPYQYKGRGEE